MSILKITMPLKLPSLANCRMHWRAMNRLKKGQKAVVAICLQGKALPPLPVVVTITRFGPRRLDDDNLAMSAKYVRDQIAAAYGVDDGSSLYQWRYEQRIGKGYLVEVEIATA